MNSCCTTLQTHVRIRIDLVCSSGEIDGCSRNIGMQIDTFVDFISTWINLSRQKIVWEYIVIQYIKSISHLLKYSPPNLRYPAKYYQKGSCFLTIIVLLSNTTLSKYVLLSKRSAQYNNITLSLLHLSIGNLKKVVNHHYILILQQLMRTRGGNQYCVKYIIQIKLNITGV